MLIECSGYEGNPCPKKNKKEFKKKCTWRCNSCWKTLIIKEKIEEKKQKDMMRKYGWDEKNDPYGFKFLEMHTSHWENGPNDLPIRIGPKGLPIEKKYLKWYLENKRPDLLEKQKQEQKQKKIEEKEKKEKAVKQLQYLKAKSALDKLMNRNRV